MLDRVVQVYFMQAEGVFTATFLQVVSDGVWHEKTERWGEVVRGNGLRDLVAEGDVLAVMGQDA